MNGAPKKIEQQHLRPADVLRDPQRLKVYEVLREKGEIYSIMYLGAFVAIEDKENPDCIAQSAHSVRELMEKTERNIFNYNLQKGGSMNDKVRDLDRVWTKHSHDIDQKAVMPSELSEKLKALSSWLKDERPNKRRLVAMGIRMRDPFGRKMPANIEESLAEEWLQLREWFDTVSHHGNTTVSIQELEDKIKSLESQLLNHFLPPAAADLNEIDMIIREGEASDL